MTNINNNLNQNNTYKIRQSLINWFNNTNPQYFLTIQLPKYLRSTSIISSNKKLYKIMSTFERSALGRHWNKKHIPFISVAEHGKSFFWHYHILIYNCRFNIFEMQHIFNNVLTELKLPKETFFVEPVLTPGVNAYTSKEFKADINKHFDTDRIITSEILFNLPYKPITRIPESQNQSQNHEN